VRTLITTVAIGLAAIAPAAAAEARAPVTRADAWHAAQRLAEQSATGVEDLTNGAASVDRSRTSIGNYLRYGRFRMGASFAVFGTNTVGGWRTRSGVSAISRSCGRRAASYGRRAASYGSR
jgi:hypothetical protein